MSFRWRLNRSAAGKGVCCLARLPAGKKKIIHNTAKKARNQMVKSASPSSRPSVDVKLVPDDHSDADFRGSGREAEGVYLCLVAYGGEMTPQLIATHASIAELNCDAVVVGAYSGEQISLTEEADALNGELGGRLMDQLRSTRFQAKPGEVESITTLGAVPARTIVVAGLGSRDEVGPKHVRRAGAASARRVSEASEVACALPSLREEGWGAAAEGFLLAAYRFDAYKSNAKAARLEKVHFPGAATQALDRGGAYADAIALARNLTNEPASVLTPTELARRAVEIADAAGLERTILDESELRDLGFGGLLGVAAGSSEPPRLIRLRYAPDQASGRITLVGKGVTFDSGGLSLKPWQSMQAMKTDMAGGAAVLGVMSALRRLGVGVEVTGIVPATENMVSGNALKPGDVIRHYGGKTCEVINTDAEGRLILADTLAWASEDKPDSLVDVATLTSTIRMALGTRVSGLFCADVELRRGLLDAADSSGEDMWHMPFYDAYESEIASDVADLRNRGTGYGGAIIAALFLRNFVGEEIAWAHLDIAGTARAESSTDEYPKGGTGIPTRTLLRWLEGKGR
jgi:leucyl aminopeptidase